jgi:hypothetical protein
MLQELRDRMEQLMHGAATRAAEDDVDADAMRIQDLHAELERRGELLQSAKKDAEQVSCKLAADAQLLLSKTLITITTAWRHPSSARMCVTLHPVSMNSLADALSIGVCSEHVCWLCRLAVRPSRHSSDTVRHCSRSGSTGCSSEQRCAGGRRGCWRP